MGLCGPSKVRGEMDQEMVLWTAEYGVQIILYYLDTRLGTVVHPVVPVRWLDLCRTNLLTPVSDLYIDNITSMTIPH